MSMKIIIRVKKQQHNFLLCGEDVCQTVEDVKQFCYLRFPYLQTEENLKIYWNDQDGDEICVITDGDYRSFTQATETEKRRLYVESTEKDEQLDASVRKEKKAPNPEPSAVAIRPVHSSIICDVCDKIIVGHRYRCLTCYDYDLCMACEAKYRHKDHIMLRIPRPTVGSRAVSHLVFENLEQHVRRLKLAAEEPSPLANNDDPTRNNGTHPNATPCGMRRRQQPTLRNAQCPRRMKMQAATAAAAAMLNEDALTNFREALSRYIDPANIKGTVEQPVGGTNVTSPQPAPTNAEVLNETQRSIKIASDAAKVASAAAAASWNTFRSCAGMFVPVVNPSTTSGLTATQSTGDQCNSSEQATTAENSATSQNAPAVSGIVNEVLKHTPPELKEFLPKEDEINRFSEKLSTLLSNLGVELNLPATVAGESAAPSVVPSTGSSASVEETTKTQAETPSTETMDTSAEPNVAGKEQQTASVCADNGASLDGKNIAQSMEIGECSGETSSASMLSDDDGDDMDTAQVFEQPSNPEPSTSRQEVPWILVDLPYTEEEGKQNVANAPSSTPISTETPSSEAKKKDTQLSELESIENSLQNGFILLKKLYGQSNPALINHVEQDLKRIQDERNKQSNADNERNKSNSEKGVKESEPLPIASSSAVASSETPTASTSSAKAPSIPAAPNKLYSPRPHVNHAIHTMMTMGFSNQDGHLTQLLEALDGDIPRALDLLMQKLS